MTEIDGDPSIPVELVGISTQGSAVGVKQFLSKVVLNATVSLHCGVGKFIMKS